MKSNENIHLSKKRDINMNKVKRCQRFSFSWSVRCICLCINRIKPINVAEFYRRLLELKMGCPASVQRGNWLSCRASFSGGSVAAPISPGFSDV